MINNKNLLDFLEKISKDKEKAQKLISYSDINEMYEYALSESDGSFTKEEFMSVIEEIIKLMSKVLSDAENSGKSPEEIISEMSDNSLRGISGGAGNGNNAANTTPNTGETTLRSLVNLADPTVRLVSIITDAHFKSREREDRAKQMEIIKPFTEVQQELGILQTKIQIEKAKKELAALTGETDKV